MLLRSASDLLRSLTSWSRLYRHVGIGGSTWLDFPEGGTGLAGFCEGANGCIWGLDGDAGTSAVALVGDESACEAVGSGEVPCSRSHCFAMVVDLRKS